MRKYSAFSYAAEDAGRVLDMTLEELRYGRDLISNFLRLDEELVKVATVHDVICDTVVADKLLPHIRDYYAAIKFLRELNDCLSNY